MRRILSNVGAFAFVSLALFLVALKPAEGITTTTVTSTIIGNLVPDSAHLSNTLIVTIFPLIGMVTLSMFPMIFHRKGDVVIYFALSGWVLGAIASDLSVNTTSTNATPFALIVTGAILLFLWWWNS